MTRAFAILSFALIASQVEAQSGPPSSVADSSAGRVGQRRAQTDTPTGSIPAARLSTRIDSRVETRIRNRIDRYYRQRTTTDAFEEATETTRATAVSSPR